MTNKKDLKQSHTITFLCSGDVDIIYRTCNPEKTAVLLKKLCERPGRGFFCSLTNALRQHGKSGVQLFYKDCFYF